MSSFTLDLRMDKAIESGFMGRDCLEVSASRHLGMMGIVHSSVVEIVV